MNLNRAKYALIAAAGVVALGMTGSSFAADKMAGGNSMMSSTASTTKSDPAEKGKAQVAAQTAKYGLDNKDPYSLLAAAEMMKGLKSKVAVLDAANSGKKGAPTYDATALLKAAKSYAAGNADLTKVIDAKLAQAGKGQYVVVNGVVYCVWDYYWEYGSSGWGWYYDCA